MDKFVLVMNPPSEILGLIATSDIQPGELIFNDLTPISAPCQPKTWKNEGINQPLCDHCYGIAVLKLNGQNQPKPKVFKPKCCDANFAAENASILLARRITVLSVANTSNGLRNLPVLQDRRVRW